MNKYSNQVAIEMTPMVKKIVIANAAIWGVLVFIVQQFFLKKPYFFQYFGLQPASFFFDFFLWQPFTYMFFHSNSFFHILFNMLVVWMFGSELEARWGGRFFLIYYLVSGIGAGVIYSIVTTGYYFFSGDIKPMLQTVIGASGATYGIILAYGIIFSERVLLFMFLFPMKAKHFCLLLGGIELVSLLSSGYGSEVSNLAHLGGILSGYLFLVGYTKYKNRHLKKPSSKHGRKLKLVVDNERKPKDGNGPRYWN